MGEDEGDKKTPSPVPRPPPEVPGLPRTSLSRLARMQSALDLILEAQAKVGWVLNGYLFPTSPLLLGYETHT